MKSSRLLPIALLGCYALASAQNSPNNTLPPVQAPPAINEPGVTAPAAPADAASAPTVDAAAAAAAEVEAAPAQKSIESPGLPADVQAAAEATELPVITVRQHGSETVEEYRKRGKLYFVRVLTKEGPPRFYVDNPASIPPNVMQQLSGPSGVVQPVYFKLAEWK